LLENLCKWEWEGYKFFLWPHSRLSLNDIRGTRIPSWELQFPSPHAHACHFLCHFLHKEKLSPYKLRERARKLATSNLLYAATVGIQQKKCYYIGVRADISPDGMSHGKVSQTPIFLQL
jgi:hypothetical protein